MDGNLHVASCTTGFVLRGYFTVFRRLKVPAAIAKVLSVKNGHLETI